MKKLFLTVLLFFIGLPAYGAVLSISPNEIGVTGEALLDIRIDTEDASVNALEMTVTLSADAVVLEEVYEGKSVVSFWTQAARIEGNSVTLSGIIPGGFRGEGVVTTLKVSGVRAGETQVRISDISVLLNDGAGTSVPTRLSDMTLSVSEGAEHIPPVPDITPPEPFTVSVVADDSIEGGKFVAVFAARDKQTGIATYEIQETTLLAPEEHMWIEATSPHVLSDQTLSRRIFVRATDYAGNVYVTQWEQGKGISMLEGALYLVLLLIGILLIFALYVRRAHRKRLGIGRQ